MVINNNIIKRHTTMKSFFGTYFYFYFYFSNK